MIYGSIAINPYKNISCQKWPREMESIREETEKRN